MWLIANSMSKATDWQVIEQTCAVIGENGYRLIKLVDLGKEALPTQKPLPDIIACLGGDGTANAAIAQYGEEAGVALLVLPGGTMNLLAHKLHGDADVATIIEKAANGGEIVRLPQIAGRGFRSLVGVIAGATAAWGEVREALRSGDVEAIVEEARDALQTTLSEPGVRLGNHDPLYTAIFIEPREDMLCAQEIKADTLADIAQHGWAWLNRDFLGGPLVHLDEAPEITLSDSTGKLAMLVDGERMSVPSPVRLYAEMCPARFLGTLE